MQSEHYWKEVHFLINRMPHFWLLNHLQVLKSYLYEPHSKGNELSVKWSFLWDIPLFPWKRGKNLHERQQHSKYHPEYRYLHHCKEPSLKKLLPFDPPKESSLFYLLLINLHFWIAQGLTLKMNIWWLLCIFFSHMVFQKEYYSL